MVAAGAGAVAIASFNGTIELLVLASGGAFLAHRGILTGRAVYAFSQTLIQLLIPCLMYYSIVDGLQALKQHFSMSNLAEIVFPPFLCVITLAIGWAAAVPCVWLLGRGKDECVRRGIIVCIMVGNGRSFPLLILSALCDNFGPFRADGRCIGRSAQIVSLYTMVWQIMLWVPIFAYLINAPAAAEDLQDEEAPLVSTESTANRPGWLSTITLSVVAAVVTMLIPDLPEALSEDGKLAPVYAAIRLIGGMVVPTSMIIMGSKLYSSQTKDKSESSSAMYVPQRKKFGLKVHAGIFAMRMLVLPFIGRMLFRLFNMWAIPGKLLKVYYLINFSVPTANNTIMVFVVMTQLLPSLGPQLEEDVATTIFYQYMSIPLFFTLNTALALNLVFNEGPAAAAAKIAA